jgi:hypothetical protein
MQNIVGGVISIPDALRDGPNGKGPFGRTRLYELIGDNTIETVVVGRRRYIKVASWRKLFATAEAA